MNTLKFASTAANICNRPIANIRITPISNIPMTINNVVRNNNSNQQHFVPIGAPAHLYPPPYGSALTSNGQYAINQQSQDSNHNVGSIKESVDAPQDTEDELFKLRFAASQWQLLVTNAATLLNELVSTGALADETQNRIESWLCMKEEYQHCIEPDLMAIKPRNKCEPSTSSSTSRRTATQNQVSSQQRDTDSKALHVIGN